MNWDALDYTVFGAMVAGVVLGYRFLARQADSSAYRLAAGVALAAAFVLVWVNGAVGIIGNEGSAANLMFAGVLAVGVVGALIARFEAAGMMRALIATAAAQALVAVIVLIGGFGASGSGWPFDILALSGFFAALWLTSAWLFGKAVANQRPEGAQPG